MHVPSAFIKTAKLGLLLATPVILALAVAPTEHAEGTGSSLINHLLAFYVLSLLTDYAFPNSDFGLHKALPLLGFGMLIELIQLGLPHRHFSLLDVAVDAVGIGLYALSRPLLRKLPLLRLRWEGAR